MFFSFFNQQTQIEKKNNVKILQLKEKVVCCAVYKNTQGSDLGSLTNDDYPFLEGRWRV